MQNLNGSLDLLRHAVLLVLVATVLVVFVGCDGGLAPREESGFGAIRGVVTYTPADAWPPSDSLVDLRFIALTFVPRDTMDLFRDINSLVFSEGLERHVARDTFVIDEVPAQNYIFAGVARQFSRSFFDWQPLAIYEENSGIIPVRPDQVTEIHIEVDFNNLPVFPPPEE